MIDNENILGELLNGHVAAWCSADMDANALAGVVDDAIAHGVHDISVGTSAVKIVWPWVEQTKIQISTRFYVPTRPRGIGAADASELTMNINSAFKCGATCAQMFMRVIDLGTIVKNLGPIREDLFFNKKLSVGLDICKIEPSDWSDVFDALNALGASSVIFAMSHDMGDKSDFVGRFYGALNAMGTFKGEVHFAPMANPVRIDQVMRLTEQLRPEKLSNLKFFIG